MVFIDVAAAGRPDDGFLAEPFEVRHRLSDHPLVGHDALVDLAGRLPLTSIEHHRGIELPLVVTDADTPRLPDDPVSMARHIATNGCWMVFWNVEQLPEYHRLLDETVDEVMVAWGRPPGWATRREAFIFLSAPDSVTPAHIDPEHNFLLQIRGSKRVTVGSFDDPWRRQLAAERLFGGDRNLEALPPASQSFALAPGSGVYVPVLAPHWVHNGPELCVSFSATFRTPETERAELVHIFNRRARRLHLRRAPLPPGEVELVDRVKAATVQLASHAVGRWARARRRTALAKRYARP